MGKTIDLDAVLAKAAWLKSLADQYQGDTGMKASGIVAPMNAFGGSFPYQGFTLFGLPVFTHGERWALVVEPDQGD